MIQLSTRVRYAARAMIELAVNYEKAPVQLHEIACKQDISVKYLEQIMAPLRTRGFVRTQKGSRGGYHMAIKPENITLYDIVECVEGSMSPVACLDNEDSCERTDKCVTRRIWSNVQEAISRELKAVSLSELASEQKTLYSSNDNVEPG